MDQNTQHAKAPGAQCWECPFENAPFVPTQNPRPKSKLAVIGEAPGAYEAGRGIPFTGPSGRLLDRVLEYHGYHRQDVMVTNICLCRPVDNADPPKSAIAACKPRLDAELAASGVDKILAVGGTSASTLIDPKKKISSLRIGPPKPYIENPQVSVVASWHPAYCLRSPDAFPSLVSDTAKLKGNKHGLWTEPKFRTFESSDIILRAIGRLEEISGPIVIDIECGVEKDFSFAHPDQYDLLCLGISYEPGKAVVFGGGGLENEEVQVRLRNYLRNRPLIAHNGKFDLGGLFPVLGELELFADTMLMSYSIDERPGQHGLKKLGIELLGTPDWEAEVKKYIPRGKDYSAIPRPILYRYNAYDVVTTRALYDYFLSIMGERETALHKFLIQASNAIIHLERAGITFDDEYSRKLETEFESELLDLEMQIERVANRTINPRSPMQITRWFSDQNFMLNTTQADVLEVVAARPNTPEKIRKFVELLLLHRRRTKLNGTYVKGFQKRIHNGKVFTTYSLHGTTSGRLASKNPNLQNIVRDKRIKNQFTVEDEKNILIQLDYKQAEGRVITTLAEDEYLASIFRDPTRDIFNELTTQIYGENNWGKEERVKIKSVFYGLSYGRGSDSIARELGISTSESSELLRNFKRLIPATVRWQNSIADDVLAGKDLQTRFGRKRSFYLITNENRADVINEALSFIPQSTASDICLSALIKLQPKLKPLIAKIRLTIHDALILECKEAIADEVISLATDCMVDAGRDFTNFVPFVVDVSRGKRWSDL